MKLLLKLVGGFVVLLVGGIAAVFYLTSGMVDEVDSFFAAVKERNTEQAYEMLAGEFKRTTSLEALDQFLHGADLYGAKETNWTNRQFSGDQGTVNGSVTTASGSTTPLEISFVKEEGQWKILGIHKVQAGLQEKTADGKLALSLPPEEAQVKLVKEAMRNFGVSINAKDMTAFHQHISQMWQSQFDTAKLEQAFGKLYEMDGDLTKVSNLSPVFQEPAKLDEKGVMHIAGFFPTTPKQVKFEQKYIQEGTQWKLLGFNINITG